MPKSIPRALRPEHVLKALADLDGRIDHSFGKAQGYELVHGGNRYAPKAVIGVAFRHVTGEILHHSEFSGGEAPGQANYELRHPVVNRVAGACKEDRSEPASGAIHGYRLIESKLPAAPIGILEVEGTRIEQTARKIGLFFDAKRPEFSKLESGLFLVYAYQLGDERGFPSAGNEDLWQVARQVPGRVWSKAFTGKL